MSFSETSPRPAWIIDTLMSLVPSSDKALARASMDQTLGAYSILACQKAMDEAGVTADQIDGVICCDSHIAGGSGGSASQWAPRPYFAPPYDSEWGLTLVNAKWLIVRRRRRPCCR